MIPIYDSIKSRRVPVITYTIIALNLLVFGYQIALGERVNDLVMSLGLVPWKMTRGIAQTGFHFRDHALPWVTHMFLHGGWVHLLGNLWFLHIFGDNVEDRLGRGRFLVLYLCGGLVAALLQIMTAPGDMSPMIGASGAISTIVAAYLLFYPRAMVLTLFFVIFVPIPAFIFIGLWFAVQLLSGYSALLSQASGGVAWWAHIGGFVAGIFLAWVLRPESPDPVPRHLGRRWRLVGSRRL